MPNKNKTKTTNDNKAARGRDNLSLLSRKEAIGNNTSANKKEKKNGTSTFFATSAMYTRAIKLTKVIASRAIKGGDVLINGMEFYKKAEKIIPQLTAPILHL
jgi:hypothetical protein